MLDKIDSHRPMFDAQTICSEIENLGKVCKEVVKREMKGKYFYIATYHWTSKKIDNYAVLTAKCIEGGKFKSCLFHFEHHRGRTRG